MSGWVVPCDEPPEQHFFPLPLRQHRIAPPSLLHIFAPLSLQHVLSQPPLQHFSPLHAPCLAIGQLAPIGVCGAWAIVSAVKTSSNDRKLNNLFMRISLSLKCESQIEPQVQKPWDCFICVKARSGLDPKDLEENVSGGSGCKSVAGRRSYEGRICLRGNLGRHCKEIRSASFWFDSCRQLSNTQRQSVVTATLAATRSGDLMMHGTVHAHPAHGLVATRSAVSAGGSSHLAWQTGEGRLGGEQRNSNEGGELDEPLHLIQLNTSTNMPKYVSQITSEVILE